MYEKDGEKYFVLDTHTHFWDASPQNWVKGAEEYAKGWIECFHAYQGLGPPETHWPLEKFQKYTAEDFERDMFEEGHVDVAIFQPTYLKEWYTDGFNTSEQDAVMAARHPDRLIVNGRFDPRDGVAERRTRHQVEREGHRRELRLVIDGERGPVGGIAGHRRERHLHAVVGAHVDVAQDVGPLPVRRPHFHHDVVLVQRRVGDRHLPLAEGIVERLVDQVR